MSIFVNAKFNENEIYLSQRTGKKTQSDYAFEGYRQTDHNVMYIGTLILSHLAALSITYNN